MQFVKHYRDLNTNLNGVYDGMKKELQAQKDLDIVNELEGDNDGIPFKTILAIRKSVPRAFVGALREVTFTITGEKDDFVVEVHTGSWFNNMIGPATGGAIAGSVVPVIGTAIGAAAGAGTSTVIGMNYHRTLQNEIRSLVEKNSKNKFQIHNVEHY